MSMTELELAKQELTAGDWTCVIRKDGEITTSKERGVKPLLGFLDDGKDLRGAFAADKVVGAGAAFLYVLLGVREVYAGVMSEPAKQVLTEHGVQTKCDQLVPRIWNRAGTGSCPIEEAVSGEQEPQEALKKIRARLAELQAQK